MRVQTTWLEPSRYILKWWCNRQLIYHETRVSGLEMTIERLKDILTRVTKAEEEISATNNRASNLERN